MQVQVQRTLYFTLTLLMCKPQKCIFIWGISIYIYKWCIEK